MSTSPDKLDKAELYSNISEWLAKGFDDAQIINELQTDEVGISENEAQRALKDVYTHWQHTNEVLDLQDSDLIEWHVYLRKRILQTLLSRDDASSLRVALATLDSLATIQGVAAVPSQTVPLQITLTEKKDDTAS